MLGSLANEHPVSFQTAAQTLHWIGGLSWRDAKRALEAASTRFQGRVILGALWVHCMSLAVSIRQDRAAWAETAAQRALDAGNIPVSLQGCVCDVLID